MKFSKQVSKDQALKNKYKYSRTYSKMPMTFETIDWKYFALNPQDSLIRNVGHLNNFLHVLILISFLFDLETVWPKRGGLSLRVGFHANESQRTWTFFAHCRNFFTSVSSGKIFVQVSVFEEQNLTVSLIHVYCELHLEIVYVYLIRFVTMQPTPNR